MEIIKLSEHPWTKYLLRDILELTRKLVLNWGRIIVNIGWPGEERERAITAFIENVSHVYENLMKKIYKHITDDDHLEIEIPEYDAGGICEEEILLQESNLSEHPWVQETLDNIVGIVRKNLLNWCSMLVEMDVTGEIEERWISYCIGKVSNWYKRILQAVAELQDDLSHKIKNQLEIIEYLHCEIFKTEKPPIYDDVKGLGLHGKLEFLKETINRETYKEIYFERNWLKFLWGFFDDPSLQNYAGDSLEILSTLRREVKCCEILLQNDIEVTVKLLRKELVNMWDKCHLADEERNFDYVKVDKFTEKSVQMHYRELRKIKKFYNENREIYNLLEKREELYVQRETLAIQHTTYLSRYNTRLFRKEKKERSALSKRLEQIESQLLKLAQNFQLRTGRKFLSWGKTVDFIIFQAREKYIEKEIELYVRKRLQNKTSTPRKSMFGLPRWRKNLETLERVLKRTINRTLNSTRPCGPYRYSVDRAKHVKNYVRKMKIFLVNENTERSGTLRLTYLRKLSDRNTDEWQIL